MAYTWTGSAVTGRVAGDSQDYMAIAILHNDRYSSHNVTVRRAMMQCDMTNVVGSTTLFVPVLTYRGTGSPTVGDYVCTATKASFDTAQSSDPLVKLYYPATGDGINDSVLAGAASGGIVWRQWGTKLRTAAEQQLAYDNNQLPALCATKNFVIRPNEYLVFRADAVVAGTGATIGDNNPGLGWFLNLVWQEEAVATHTIGGTVTLSGTGVVGAKVIVLVADDTSLTNATLWGTYTTTSGGSWTSDPIPDGKYAYAYAQNDAGGGTYYSATGAPFIS